jgi:CDP-diacylglycerol---glycerol-3-phosphate 3-phosphatidyltransferase
MTLANKLTVSRMIVIPLMVIVMVLPSLETKSGIFSLSIGELIFALLFVMASATDFLDGHIARKRQQITTFGKFLDPLADKILVVTALLFLMVDMPSRVPVAAVLLIIAREFVVTGIRLLAVGEGKVIAASKLGKAKTAATMLALVIMLFDDFGMPAMIGNVVFFVAVALTVWSGIEYFFKNKDIIFKSM